MARENDWLNDPLYDEWKKGEDEWSAFHSSTRLKLEAAAYHYRMVMGSSSLVPSLDPAGMFYRLQRWHLGSCFFELVSAFDCLRQEMNSRFELGLKREKVSWKNLQKNSDKIPEKLFQFINEQRKEEWFKRVCEYRNTATHRFLLPLQTMWGGMLGDHPEIRPDEHEIEMGTERYGREPIRKCQEYLESMTRLIIDAWQMF